MTDLAAAYADRRVLLLGGLGLIGSTLAHRLVALGARVTILDAALPTYGANRTNLAGIADRIAVEIGDIRDEAMMARLIPGQACIVNLAAQASYNDSLDDPFLDLDINCRGHLLLLELCRTRNPDARVLFAGSRLQFGRIVRLPADEDHPQTPLMPYGVAKLAAEKYSQMYHHTHGLRTTVLRLANPYGPRQQMRHSKYGILNWFLRLAMDDETIPVYGDGRQVRDYVYVEDIASAFLAAGAAEAAVGEVFNVGSGLGTSFRAMAERVTAIVGGGRVVSVPWPADYPRIDTGDYVADIARIKRGLGWTPLTPLDEGIARTHQYYRAHRAAYWP